MPTTNCELYNFSCNLLIIQRSCSLKEEQISDRLNWFKIQQNWVFPAPAPPKIFFFFPWELYHRIWKWYLACWIWQQNMECFFLQEISLSFIHLLISRWEYFFSSSMNLTIFRSISCLVTIYLVLKCIPVAAFLNMF